MTQNDTHIDTLFTRLRETEPEISDANFTAGVMSRLPARRRLATWQKNALLLTATATGSALAAAQIPPTAISTALLTLLNDVPLLLGSAAVITYATAAVAGWLALNN